MLVYTICRLYRIVDTAPDGPCAGIRFRARRTAYVLVGSENAPGRPSAIRFRIRKRRSVAAGTDFKKGSTTVTPTIARIEPTVGV